MGTLSFFSFSSNTLFLFIEFVFIFASCVLAIHLGQTEKSTVLQFSFSGPKIATRQSIVTRSKKHIPEEPEKATTFAILKPARKSVATAQAAVTTPPSAPLEHKEAREAKEAKENKKQPPPKAPSKASPPKEAKDKDKEPRKDGRYPYYPRERSKALPCAQYKTEANKYKCPNCQRCYNARKNLVRHVTLECGREPQYKCPHCVFSKHRRNELKKHLERKHPEHVRVKTPPPDSPDDARPE